MQIRVICTPIICISHECVHTERIYIYIYIIPLYIHVYNIQCIMYNVYTRRYYSQRTRVIIIVTYYTL